MYISVVQLAPMVCHPLRLSTSGLFNLSPATTVYHQHVQFVTCYNSLPLACSVSHLLQLSSTRFIHFATRYVCLLPACSLSHLLRLSTTCLFSLSPATTVYHQLVQFVTCYNCLPLACLVCHPLQLSTTSLFSLSPATTDYHWPV